MGFDLPAFCNLCHKVRSHLRSGSSNKLARLVEVLSSHDSLPSRNGL